MNTIDLKTDLFKLIDEIDDINILYAIKVLLSKPQAPSVSTDFWDELPDFVQNDIQESVKQADAGNFTSHRDVMQNIKAKYLNHES